MATGVGNPRVLRAVGTIPQLLHGQGIHVGTNHDSLAGTFLTVNKTHQAGDGISPADFHTHGGQFSFNEITSLYLLGAKLRMRMNLTADLDLPLRLLFCQALYTGHKSSSASF